MYAGVSAVILDHSLAAVSPLSTLSDCVELAGSVPVIILSFNDSVPFAVDSVNLGAADYIVLPCGQHYIEQRINRVIKRFTRSSGNRSSSELHVPLVQKNAVKKDAHFSHALGRIIGSSDSSDLLRKRLVKYAMSDHPVLIQGETGTGKSFLAQIIHDISHRCSSVFLPVNCANLDEKLAENELFGSCKGAFTDSLDHDGYFAQCADGTLFFDELSEMNSSVQAKLLHVFDSGHYYRIGSAAKKHTGVRCIFATNADTQQLVKKGLFRSDLFYRIACLTLTVPPLRERKSEIPEFMSQFLGEYELTSDAAEKIMEYDWPGNIRQLKICLERAKVYSDSYVIGSDDILFH